MFLIELFNQQKQERSLINLIYYKLIKMQRMSTRNFAASEVQNCYEIEELKFF